MPEEFKCFKTSFIMKINTILKAEVMQNFIYGQSKSE